MKTDRRTDIALLVLRIGLGLTMLYFGSQKALGLFGGGGFAETVKMFHDKMGIPVVFAYLGIAGEFLGGLGVLSGLLTRIAAFGVACTMATATFMSMKAPGAFISIFDGSKGDPSKLFFPGMLCIVAIFLLIMGPGAYSLDNRFFRKSRR